MTSENFPWRAPLSSNWGERLEIFEAALIDGRDLDFHAVRSLAGQRLTTREQLRLERFANKLLKSDIPSPTFAPVSIGLLGNRTLSYLPGPLAAAGLARGLAISSVEAPYDSVASYAYSPSDCFGKPLDAVLVVLDETAFANKRPILDRAAEEEAIAAAEDLFSALAAATLEKSQCRPIFATLPAAQQVSSAELATPGTSARFRHLVNLKLAEGAMLGKWLIWDQAGLASRVGIENWLDPIRSGS